MKTVLVVEDQPDMLDLERMYLQSAGFSVLTAKDGRSAVATVEAQTVDLVLLDVMLPQIDGWEVCKRVRQKSYVPIIMVTAKAEELDRVLGLELGADDYITKPFSPRELVARVRALLRRIEFEQVPEQPKRISFGDLQIDVAAHKVFLGGTELQLTPKEFDLLIFLVQHTGIAFSREQLLEYVWGHACEGSDRMVDALVKRLRRKIEDDLNTPKYVETVRGVGYRCLASRA